MKKSLMVVDDSLMMELIIRKLLEGTDYEVVAYCENGEEAIDEYENILPDVVTLDLIMPGIDGLETAQVILDKHPEAKLIIVSSISDADTISEIKNTGIYTFLLKPITRENLLQTLDKVFE